MSKFAMGQRVTLHPEPYPEFRQYVGKFAKVVGLEGEIVHLCWEGHEDDVQYWHESHLELVPC